MSIVKTQWGLFHLLLPGFIWKAFVTSTIWNHTKNQAPCSSSFNSVIYNQNSSCHLVRMKSTLILFGNMWNSTCQIWLDSWGSAVNEFSIISQKEGECLRTFIIFTPTSRPFLCEHTSKKWSFSACKKGIPWLKRGPL